MAATHNAAVATSADIRQAAYFRGELDELRRHLIGKVLVRRALIDRRAHTGALRGQIHDAEAEVRRLDRMIARIDARFGPQIAALGS